MTVINLNAIGWQDVTAEKSGDDKQKNNAPVNANEFVTLPAGGYVCKILGASINTTKNGKQMIVLRLEIAEGEYAGHFARQTDWLRKYNPAVDWDKSGIYWQLVKDDTGQMHKFLKAVLLMIARSNPDYISDYSVTFDEQKLVGKLIGMVFGEQTFQKCDGSSVTRIVPKIPKNIEDIRNGNFTIPEQKNNAPVNADVIPTIAQNDSTPATNMQSDFDPRADSAASSSSKLSQLQAELANVNAEMKAFESERDNAFETLKNLQTFDSKAIFADDVKRGAAFAKLFNLQLLAETKQAIKNYGDSKEHKREKISLHDWTASFDDEVVTIFYRYNDLEQRRKNLIATIKTIQFAEQCVDVSNFSTIAGFRVDETGVWRLQGNKPDVVVARRPVYFVGKFYNVDDQIHSVQLAVMDDDKKLHKLPLVDKATTADRGKIIALANHGLPVSSATATELVGYLDAFYITNESKIPLSYLVNRCGWHKINGTEIFVDPRSDCTVSTETGKNIPVVVDSKSQFAQSLTTAGNIDEWKRAYEVAKKSPVARLIVAACVAAPLLKILHERNFMLYIHAKTRAGKTTALYLGASAVGSEKTVRSFDATQNGLIGAAADVNDYPFLIDEKQVINPKLREQLSNLVYGLSNGIGKTRLNRDTSNRKVQDWRTITIATGETEFLDDNATGGAHTRLLSIKAPETILSAEDCKTIRQTIADNYGHALPLVIDKIIDVGKSTLIEMFDDLVDVLQSRREDLLSEHCRYLGVLAIGDYLLNAALGVADETALKDATLTATVDVLPLVPTRAEIDDTARERDFVLNFIAQNQNHFIGGSVELRKMQGVYGELAKDGYDYIIAAALKAECQRFGYDYRKLVDDLIADGFFVPSNVVKKGHKQPLKTVQRRIGEANATCYRMPIERTADDAEEAL